MGEARTEYGVQVMPDGAVMVVGSTPGAREHAIDVANRLNDRTDTTHMAVQRLVTVTEWAPFNTGVVGPHGTDE